MKIYNRTKKILVFLKKKIVSLCTDPDRKKGYVDPKLLLIPVTVLNQLACYLAPKAKEYFEEKCKNDKVSNEDNELKN